MDVRKYLPRLLESRLKKAAGQFPVLVLTGPRQTGKSTLLRRLFPRHAYATLDDPRQLALAKKDPRLFLENLGSGAVIDEIQYAPELLAYIKMAVDEMRAPGRFILTGSQIFPLMAGLSESLAGRAALFELLGFSWKELTSVPFQSARDCFRQIFKGFYPDPAVHGAAPADYYGSYLQTYLERDIRQVKAVHDLSTFQSFLELIAARAGSLLNLSEVSKECGISHANARQWLSLLESTRIVYLLRPYFRNVSKRVVKHPKLYFTDTGLLSYLLKYPDAETLRAGPAAGALFENMIVMEFLKEKLNRRGLFELYFFRDSNGNEADLVLDWGRRLTPIEIKQSRTLRADHIQGLARVARTLGAHPAFLLSQASEAAALEDGILGRPWWRLAEIAAAPAPNRKDG